MSLRTPFLLCLALAACTTSHTDDAGSLPPYACLVGGIGYDADAGDPGNGCQFCQPLVSSSAFSPRADGTLCQAGLCAAGSCVSDRCYIDGQLVAAGAADPTLACMSCQPAVNLVSSAVAPDTFPCMDGDGGNFCQGGTCEPRCLIDGGLLPPDAGSPNGCQFCDPSNDRAWTLRADGNPCSVTGTFCIGGECAIACQIPGAGLVYDGSFPIGDPTQCCSPAISTSAYSFLLFLPDAGPVSAPPSRLLAAGNFNGPQGGRGLLLWSGTQVLVYLPSADGGFGPGQSLGNGDSPVVADFDGDGNDDVAMLVPGGIAVFLGRSIGPPMASPLLAAPDAGFALAVAGIRGAAHPDLALLTGGEGSPVDLWIFGNDGGGGFASAGPAVMLGDTTSSAVSGDFNGDGVYDLAFANYGAVNVLMGTDGGTGFVDGGVWPITAALFNGIAAGDLDGDGTDDLVLSYLDTHGFSPVVEYRGSPLGLAPASSAAVPSLPFGSLVSGVILAQFSSQSLPGLAFVLQGPPDGGQLLLQLSVGKETDAGVVVAIPVGGSTSALAASDFNGDGQTDLAVGFSDGGFVILWGQCP
jgi:hypothetical protein